MAKELSRLTPVPGSSKARTRVGRGEGSGKGKTSGRGQKGAGSRSGFSVRPGFEGGQMPLQRRLPKRGFHNKFAKDYTVVNVGKLAARFESGAEITGPLLYEQGVISRLGRDGLKVLGGGEVGHALNVKAAKFSKSAAEKLVAAGGTAETV